MTVQKEAKLSQKIVKAIHETFDNSEAYKNYGTMMGKPKLDIGGSVDGIRFEIEVKNPGSKPTPRQQARIDALKKINVITGCVTSVEEAIVLIQLGINNFMTKM